VIIGSVAGYIAAPGASPYAMSKFALRALAESLGHELRSRGVTVTIVNPGFVESEIRLVDNRGALRETARESIPRWLRMPAARAARQIARAAARRRREVVITRVGKTTVFLQRHAPWLIAGVIRVLGVRSRPEPSTG
jgi:short-subunit dehydrogenase